MFGDKSERSRIFGALGLVTGLGLTVVAAIGVCGVAGYFADQRLGTSPVLLIAGILLGVAVGAFQAYRLVMKTLDK